MSHLSAQTGTKPLPRILVVEDELPMRTVLCDCLERHGYRVLLASDGATGLDKALQEKPDLILLDVMIPSSTALPFARSCAGCRTLCPSSCSRPRAAQRTRSRAWMRGRHRR